MQSSGRVKKRLSQETDQFVGNMSFFVLEETPQAPPYPVPKDFPPRSKFLGEFTNVKDLVNTAKSFHSIQTGWLDGKKFFIKDYTPDFSKIKDDKAREEAINYAEILVTLECIGWAFYRIPTPDIVSKNVYACFEWNEQVQRYIITKVASQEVYGFEPNRKRPLTPKDLTNKAITAECKIHKDELTKILPDLSKLLDRSNSAKRNENSSYLWSIWNLAKQAFNSRWDPESASATKTIVDKLLFPNADFNHAIVRDLLLQLKPRQNRIQKLTNNFSTEYKNNYPVLYAEYEEEFKLLEKVIHLAKSYLHPDIIKYEIFDRLVIKDEKALAKEYADYDDDEEVTVTFYGHTLTVKAKDVKNCGLINKLDDSFIISKTVEDKILTLDIADLKNYRIEKGQGQCLPQSHINGEADLHNNNIAHNGLRVDPDMSEAPFVSQFKAANYDEWLDFLWKTSKFVFTARDIANNPNLEDDERRYWMTKQTKFTQLSNQSPIPFSENFYRPSDNEAYQQLPSRPGYDFNKFKTDLINILIPDKLYIRGVELFARKNLTYKITHEQKNFLGDAIATYKINRIKDFKKELINTPEFREFLERNQSGFFPLIKEDLAKLNNDPDYANMIDLNSTELEYNRIIKFLLEVTELIAAGPSITETNSTSIGIVQKP